MKKMKVAKIISTKQIVINAGEEDGIKVGDELQIIEQIGDPVKDPDTGKILGTLDKQKGKVIVSTVYSKMSIADAPTKEIINDPYSNLMRQVSAVSGGTNPLDRWKKTIRTDLNVDPDEITGGLPESQNDYAEQIHVGDTVKLIKKS